NRSGILADLVSTGTGIWRDRDIAAGWRDLETPCASLSTQAPSRPPTAARKAQFVGFRKRSGREADCPLEGDGFELPVREHRATAPSHGFAAASHRDAALRGAPASHGENVMNNGMAPEQAIDKAFKRAEAIFAKY